MWKEFDWKVKIRFFRTPLKVSMFKDNATNKCWRNCGMVGDHTHILGLSHDTDILERHQGRVGKNL